MVKYRAVAVAVAVAASGAVAVAVAVAGFTINKKSLVTLVNIYLTLQKII